jgi:hypothetical protein
MILYEQLFKYVYCIIVLLVVVLASVLVIALAIGIVSDISSLLYFCPNLVFLSGSPSSLTYILLIWKRGHWAGAQDSIDHQNANHVPFCRFLYDNHT